MAIPQVPAPNVDAKQLIRHIKALNFKALHQRSHVIAHGTTSLSLSRGGMVAHAAQPSGAVSQHLCSATECDPQAGAVPCSLRYCSELTRCGNLAWFAVVLEVTRLSVLTPRTFTIIFSMGRDWDIRALPLQQTGA